MRPRTKGYIPPRSCRVRVLLCIVMKEYLAEVVPVGGNLVSPQIGRDLMEKEQYLTKR